MIERYELSGKLDMFDEYNCTYILVENADHISIRSKFICISNILDALYFNQEIGNPIIRFEMDKRGRYCFREEGLLELRKEEKTGLYVYHIDGENLDIKLFNNVGKEVTVVIEYLGEMNNSDEVEYGKR